MKLGLQRRNGTRSICVYSLPWIFLVFEQTLLHLLRKRLRLVKANLQTVDQVRALFAFKFPSYIALIAIEIFGSTHG